MGNDGSRAVRDALLQFLEEVTHDPTVSVRVDGHENLFETGVLDSMGLVQLVTFLEERFQIRMTEGDLGSPQFTYLEGLVRIVLRHQDGSASRG